METKGHLIIKVYLQGCIRMLDTRTCIVRTCTTHNGVGSLCLPDEEANRVERATLVIIKVDIVQRFVGLERLEVNFVAKDAWARARRKRVTAIPHHRIIMLVSFLT